MTLKRYGISIVERTRRCIAAASMLFIVLSLSAQQNPYFTQHANNPLLINPAFAGGRNSLAVDIATRQQWVGVDGAPMTFMLNTHAPINETMMSAGASFYSDIAGPVMANHASLAYSYLLKINHSHFLSLGINGGINSYRVKLSDIKLNDGSDPNFASDIENEITPSFGAGLMLYSPLYYIGFSIPRILASEIEYPDAAGRQFRYNQIYYMSAGANIGISDYHSAKLATLFRFEEGMEMVYDITALYNYDGMLTAGGSIRPGYAASLILGAQVNGNIGITYSYDFPLGSKSVNLFNFQELTLSIDIHSIISPNVDREFSSPKAKSRDDGNTRSIRYF
jgi:type IX secretion system PorP/SprF family membrane protein